MGKSYSLVSLVIKDDLFFAENKRMLYNDEDGKRN
jgi:hypothetical protein